MTPSSCKHTLKHQILALSKENCLVEISLPDGPSEILIRHDYKFNPGCSFSPPIDNRYVYMIGGVNCYTGELSLQVFYYDLIDRNRYQGPSINFPKWQPDLILLESKLFAFSSFKEISEDSDPICEVLDTASKSLKWCPLKTFPNLPSPRPIDIASYIVVSYATYSSSLFLSLGNENCSFAVCYDDYAGKWSNFSETPLPFLGEGKFVADVCYAFPKIDYTIDNSNYLIAYKLAINWKTDAKVSSVELCRYSLFSDSPVKSPSYLHSFFSIDSNTFTILRTKFFETPACAEQHSLEVDVVRLLPPGHNRKRRLGVDSVLSPSSVSLESNITEGSSQVSDHASILLPHALQVILSD